MTLPALRLGAAALVISAAALFATACAATPAPEPSDDAAAAPQPTAEAPKPEETPEPTSKPAAHPTCDTLISAETVGAFTSAGWTSQEDAFWVGSKEFTDGIFCRWGDFSTANEQMQMFAWAPVSDADAASLEDELLESGWIRENAANGGVYLTESPETAYTTDDDGYGLTYLFADGHVTFADTKQGLLLVEWPRS